MTRTAPPLRSICFDGRAVLAITAHPDDECLAFGGTLSRSAATGGAVALLCLTRGDLGWGADATPEARAQLSERRSRELAESAAILGVQRLHLLDFPDGYLPHLAPAALVDAVRAEIDVVRPDVVLTFGEDGLYWHPDHIAVHRVTVRALQELPAGRPELHHAVLPAGMVRAVADAAVGGDSRAADVRVWGITPDAFGRHAPPATECVDVAQFVAQKLAALRCHRSQVEPDHVFLRLTEREGRRLLGTEYFHPMAAG